MINSSTAADPRAGCRLKNYRNDLPSQYRSCQVFEMAFSSLDNNKRLLSTIFILFSFSFLNF